MTQIGCPICESPLCTILDGINPQFQCEVCGSFALSGSAYAGVLSPESRQLTPMQRGVLSHRVRQANDAGRDPPVVTTYDVDNVIANGSLPSPAQQAVNVVRYIGERISSSGKPIDELPASFPASIGSPNRQFALRIAKQLAASGCLSALDCGDYESPDEIMELDLTLAGWERFEAEQHGLVAGNHGFMALQFGDPTLDAFLQDVIKPAVAGLGFTLVDMRDAAEAGIIDNVMRAHIRDAAFVLVDLTHANEGAYWEAGYAEGLGKPVLYLCNRQVFEETGTHFDTNHCTTVAWDASDPEGFTAQLVATLRRTLGLFG